MIVGFAGKKQSGKSTAAQALVGIGYVPMSFASTLRKMAHAVLTDLGMSTADIELAENNKEAIILKLGVSYRWILQSLGTDWGRWCIHPDLWVMIVREKIRQSTVSKIVFDDVRFDNEAALIRSEGGIIIHVRRDPGRKSGKRDTHASESGIAVLDDDLVIDNHGDLNEFIGEMLAMVDYALADIADA
ncbi:MAG: hypothetical protein M0R47_17010 [Methylobacter sp.]|uniref:deoxynucleotide monophosphate kinase family protein n=1 Tax=Methylobacter sp. TaxID=2051955 RepID=UPI0025D0536C|nr:hypothetical protein [Methylobacter sp.]MCK9622224.1 hypothetical protein [Methylobacter sp.]